MILDHGQEAFDNPDLFDAECKRMHDEIEALYESTKPEGYLVTQEDVDLAKRVVKARVNPSPARDKVIGALDRYMGEDFSKEAICAYKIED